LATNFSDEDVFFAYPDGITIRVGQCPETSARYQLEDQLEVRSFWNGWTPSCARKPARACVARFVRSDIVSDSCVLLVLVAAKPPEPPW